MALNENLTPRRTNLKWHLHHTILEGNSIGLYPKNEVQRESLWFGESRSKLMSKVVSFIVFHYFLLFFSSLVAKVEVVQ
jgi:hypothetical protein